MLLIKETLHTVSNYLGENTLTTLIDNTSKVEEIIWDPRIKLDMPKIQVSSAISLKITFKTYQ